MNWSQTWFLAVILRDALHVRSAALEGSLYIWCRSRGSVVGECFARGLAEERRPGLGRGVAKDPSLSGLVFGGKAGDGLREADKDGEENGAEDGKDGDERVVQVGVGGHGGSSGRHDRKDRWCDGWSLVNECGGSVVGRLVG